jgi:hypothetical protein
MSLNSRNTRNKKNRNTRSRKHIGGAVKEPIGTPPKPKFNANIKARVNAEKIVNRDEAETNVNEADRLANSKHQGMPKISEQFNDIRKLLIEEINKLDNDKFNMMKQNVINSIGNEGVSTYPESEPESEPKKITIEDEIDEFIILLSDKNQHILKPIHLYYIDCLLQSYMSKPTKFDLSKTQLFSQEEYDFVLKQTQLEQYNLKNKSKTFKTYIMNMLADISSHISSHIVSIESSKPKGQLTGPSGLSGLGGVGFSLW